ncbi:MAG: hypothetical protein ACLUE2_06705 [Bacteroides cellulosilyticus]
MNTSANPQAMAHYAFDKVSPISTLPITTVHPTARRKKPSGMIMKKSFLPYRDELAVSTKAGHDMWPGPYGVDGGLPGKYLMNRLSTR